MSIGGRAPAHVSFQLHDPGESKPLARAPLERVVLVSWSAASAFYDTTSIVYSRSPGALAYYQLASWSERPAEQIGRLFARRLAGTGVFRDVAAMAATVHADWLVDLQLEEMLHDDATPPGVARISVFARIVDRAARRTIDTRRFREQEPLETESAAGAAQAFEAALGRLLDESVRWVVDLALGGRSAAQAQPGSAMRGTSAAAR
ncbi:MAG TPA: ABC-type transport auxiliary lipoprotein family protein [Zeimonas sp.]